MADLFQSGISALRTFQRALAVTGNNVANASTEGYSRQRVDLVAREPQGFGYGFIGSGVEVATIRRISDQYAIGQLRSANASLGELDSFNTFAAQLDNIIGDSNTGIASGLQDFFDAWQDVANDPASASARQLLMSQAQALAQRFNATDKRLNDLDRDLNSSLRSTVDEINSLATSIAKLNDTIVRAQSGLNQPANDLLDQRDTLLNQLAQLTGINVLSEPDGAVNVYIGSGQALVTRSQSFSLGAQLDEFDPSRLQIVYEGTGGNQVITNSLSKGGELGGLLQVRSELLDPARNTLGQVATAFALSINAQHHEGMDLQGNLGGDLFTLSAPQALADAGNTGSGSVALQIADVTGLTADDYFLTFDGTNYSLHRASNGQTVTMTGTGTNADPFVANGLSIVVGGTAAAGDRFFLRPTRLGAASLTSAINDPKQIAAAAPVRTSAGSANSSSATISAGEVLDADDAGLLSTVTIQFLTANTYSVNGAGSFAYTSGSNIDRNGWRVQITGTPAAGDTFTIQSNAGGVGDGRNALSIGELQNRGVLDGGTTSISETFGALVGRVGTQAHQADINLQAQQAIASQAREQVQSISGVNLDEEAADLLRWQQAYQAAAQTIAVANNLFQTLIQAFQR